MLKCSLQLITVSLSSNVLGKSERQLYGYELNFISLCREAFYSELWPSQVKTPKGKRYYFISFSGVFALYYIILDVVPFNLGVNFVNKTNYREKP